MPDLDVTEVLLDPDFAQVLTVIRRPVTVGSNGRQSIGSTTITPAPIGVILPDDSGPIERSGEGMSQERKILVRTPFQLYPLSVDGEGNGYQPDLVVWRGDSYKVDKVMPLADFGAGWIAAECLSIDAVDQVETS